MNFSPDGAKAFFGARSQDNKTCWYFALDLSTAKARIVTSEKDPAWIGGPEAATEEPDLGHASVGRTDGRADHRRPELPKAVPIAQGCPNNSPTSQGRHGLRHRKLLLGGLKRTIGLIVPRLRRPISRWRTLTR